LALKPVLEEAREKLEVLISRHQLGDEPVEVTIGTLTVKQAIGSPQRSDFALLEGREVMIEAKFKGSFGQAFTDKPQAFTGLLRDVLDLDLGSNDKRAIFVATLNAVMAHLNMVTGVRHCHDEEPETCASEIARYIKNSYGEVKVGLVGYQPAILEHLAGTFGKNNVSCTDLNPKNVGSHRFGVKIRDGIGEKSELIRWCDILLVTSSTLTNGTFDNIRAEAALEDKRLIIFGVTGAGVSALLNLERVCFTSH
jgi:uncharacterized protein (DUF4213/DUF364 family)